MPVITDTSSSPPPNLGPPPPPPPPPLPRALFETCCVAALTPVAPVMPVITLQLSSSSAPATCPIMIILEFVLV